MRAFLNFVLRRRVNAVAIGAVALLLGPFFVVGLGNSNPQRNVTCGPFRASNTPLP